MPEHEFPGHRAMYVGPTGKYHLIRMELILTTDMEPGIRRSMCGALRAISINDVVLLALSGIPETRRCWRCWGADQ